jgi:pSer/pThr/pTyr-binding forkhead associated (FHA) protein
MAAENACKRCGHENAMLANFCSSCGANLSELLDVPTETLVMPLNPTQSAPPEQVGFLVSRGPKAGSRYLLDIGTSTLGRHPESTMFFDDITVSRRHAEVIFDGHRTVVRDVGSLNGTYLNQTPLDDETELHDGDVLQIGKFKLVFFSGVAE